MNSLRTAAGRLARPLANAPAQCRTMAGGGGGQTKVPPYKYVRGVVRDQSNFGKWLYSRNLWDLQVEHYTSPFETKKVETLVANFGHKAKHQTIDKLPDMIPAFLVLGFTIWYAPYISTCNYDEYFSVSLSNDD
jgi:hypothetical protein